MADDPIRQHIAAVTARTDAETRTLAARALGGCWPGGSDHSEPGALEWVRRWHPTRLGATLPACSCASGRCGVCN